MNWTLGYNCLSEGVSSTQNQWTGGSKSKGKPLCLFCYYNYNYSFKIYLSLAVETAEEYTKVKAKNLKDYGV